MRCTVVLGMPRAKKFKLITDPEELRMLSGGRWSRYPKPRCNQCGEPTLKVVLDKGYAAGKERYEEIGRWCSEHRHFFKIRRVTKTVATYEGFEE